MSTDLQAQSLRERLSGKWQVPLFLLSCCAFVITLVQIRSDPYRPPVDELVSHLRSLTSGLLLSEAESLARSVLAHNHYPPDQVAPIHAALADILFRNQASESVKNERVLLEILSRYAKSELLGYSLSGDALVRRGQVYEWLGQPKDALAQYETAARNHPTDMLELRRRMLALRLRDEKVSRDDVYADLTQLMADAQNRLEILKWALAQSVEQLVEQQRLEEACELLAEKEPHLEGTAHELFFNYLTAWVHFRSGQYEQAELILRDLRSRLQVRDELHAMSGWLLGRVILMDDQGLQRPLAALTFFEDVVNSHASGEFVTASLLGMAEALSDLHRFDEALQYYHRVLEALKSSPHREELVDRRAVRQSLAFRSRMQHRNGRIDSAVDYMQLATDLISPQQVELRSIYLYELGMLKKEAGELYDQRAAEKRQAGDTAESEQLEQRSRAFFLSAAEDFVELSRLQIDDETRSAAALWRAADLFDSAGRSGRTVQLLESFLDDRPSSIQIPQVLYRLGQAYQAQGMLQHAIERYQECIRDYLRTSFGQRSLLPLADCYLMMGPEKAQKAEETLLFILESAPGQPELFTPESLVYRDALFRIGDLYARSGRYEEAIARLDEALQRYPQDPRRRRATFLLADAYRQSGLELDQVATELSNALRREELRKKKSERLQKAEALFAEVIHSLSARDPSDLAAMESLHLKLSYIYRADCAFELDQLERALDQYQEVIRVYAEDTIALSAYTQLVNCLEGLGRRSEINPALRRAQWLAEKMESREFESAIVRGDSQSWKRLFGWIEQTGQYGEAPE